ncbi:MAG: GspE/PulE family protein [Candidatus Sumerlaeota bacterium]|nr:GspE/PulE family protein [Candidatus Sumerlaeota bacterium]
MSDHSKIPPEDEAAAHARSLDDLLSGEAADRRLAGPQPAADEEAAPLSPVAPGVSEFGPVLEGDFHEALATDLGREYVKLTDYPVKDVKLLRTIPLEVCKQYKCFPLREESDGLLLVAVSDPLNVTIEDDLSFRLGRHVRTVIADEEAILDAVDRYYGIGDLTIETVIEEDEKKSGPTEVSLNLTEYDLGTLEEVVNQPAVIKTVNLVLMQAIRDRASDIHIEPFEGFMRIRYRVDGVLREIPPPPKSMQLGIISRLKVLANMDISEARRPQDGRIKLTMENGREVDMRVSSLPTVHGESIVMRVLDRSVMEVGVSQIGMTKEVLERFLRICRRPNGIVLVTGPTGCGKTTTLYAALKEIYDPGEKLITTEEPVEYDLDGIVQVNINERVGLTFAACLRSILRQDPDKILVGEIRDLETAEIAIQASLTGHLVFSTLHTNSAALTVTRLIDMGVEPFLITSTTQAVIGQRLMRSICPTCKTIHQPAPEELREFGYEPKEVADLTFYEGRGCSDCNQTGYKGRMGIFELLEVNDAIRELILQRASADDLYIQAIKDGMMTMRQDGWLKICLGYTTFEEVSRQTPVEEESVRRLQKQLARERQEGRRGEEALAPRAAAASKSMAPGEEAAPATGPAPDQFGDAAAPVAPPPR